MQSLYDGLHGATKEDAEHYFPELKESDDERIRLEIRNFIWEYPDKLPERTRWLAWLEKQGEKKDYYTKQELIDMGFSFTLNGNIVTPDKMMEDMKKYLAWKEKHDEQKQADTPKFKVIEWVNPDKVIEWLKGTIRETKEYLGEHGEYYDTHLTLPYDSIEDLINDFKEDFGL